MHMILSVFQEQRPLLKGLKKIGGYTVERVVMWKEGRGDAGRSVSRPLQHSR